MSLIAEPVPVDEGADNASFIYLTQLREIVLAARNLSFTSREGAIQHADKAGNLNAVWVLFTSNGTANTEDAVTHTLGRTPQGILASLPDKGAVIYASGTAWTDTKIYLKTTVASVSWKLLVF